MHSSRLAASARPAVASGVRSLPLRPAPRPGRLIFGRKARPIEWRRPSTNDASTTPTGDAAAPAPALDDGGRKMREEMLMPLRVALTEAIVRHTKATGVREALEAEVCVLFDRAIQAESGANVDVEDVAAAAMQAVGSALKDEVEAAAVVEATKQALASTLKSLQALSTEPVEEAAVEAELAAAVADATASVDFADGPGPAGGATLAAVDGVAVRSLADSAARVDALLGAAASDAGAAAAEAGGAVAAGAAAGAAAAGAAAADRAPAPSPAAVAAAAKAEASDKARRRWAIVAAIAAAGFAGSALLQSAAGQSAVAALQSAAQPLLDKLGPIHVGDAERGLLETIYLLLTSIVCVPAVCKLIPGGSPVLGYLIGGALVGPYALNIISDVHQVQHLAELGVVFLLFTIGLELSLERLQSMAKYVFGMGAAQTVLTLLGVASVAMAFAGLPGPSAIILGGALAMSTTAVAIQVLEDRGEMGSRHGRATFSVLLFQDLAVVVLLMLIPLLAPDPVTGSSGGADKIAQALGIAAVKAVLCVGLFVAQWKSIIAALVVLVGGKLAVMMAAGGMFGLSRMAALRAGLLLSTGGEFAFVAFGEAVSKGVLPAALTNQLYLVVALSMALVPYLAALGNTVGQMFDRSDVKAMQPDEEETKELRNHVIIAGYGRVGQMIGQMLSEELIPFVAVDIDSNRVQAGRDRDLPIYFGDAGSPAVLHAVGAERAACAVITLDTPGANYRSVWAMHKHFPEVKTYVRAHDINHGLNLEKAGATVVVPETLEPSLQLAAAVLSELNLPDEEVTATVNQFRKKHLSELQNLARETGTSLGYAATSKAKDGKGPQQQPGGDGAGAPALAPTPA
ncbi:K(+) efflux antiporter chloroplastic-like [Raphidocelis subcapitata]|uniref:K(+) efflux antiporter chloroplastic-like n=1 Tax=Raphidocelis subcapitata TaxID=307507 RepID=A0A2V0P900_9CHLO|nr:K(+) efflux antiporter chloroplastic-like [Raphidocelis subcapitata]|eukprot:GBF95422.1 K(+) efflux antiporter chloroplastic-like [Raphidocelis subcapitata]